MTNNEAVEAAIELWPCPFCGGKAYLDLYEKSDGKTYFQAACDECDARTGPWCPRHSAIKYWHHRQNAGAVDLKKLTEEIADAREINPLDVRPVIDELNKRGMLKPAGGIE